MQKEYEPPISIPLPKEPEKCNGNCGMNYCDEYGCIENKPDGDVSHLLTPKPEQQDIPMEKKKNNWPDEIRLEMIELSEMYQGEEKRIYQYGFYDGYQKAIAQSPKEEKES